MRLDSLDEFVEKRKSGSFEIEPIESVRLHRSCMLFADLRMMINSISITTTERLDHPPVPPRKGDTSEIMWTQVGSPKRPRTGVVVLEGDVFFGVMVFCLCQLDTFRSSVLENRVCGYCMQPYTCRSPTCRPRLLNAMRQASTGWNHRSFPPYHRPLSYVKMQPRTLKRTCLTIAHASTCHSEYGDWRSLELR